MSNMYFDTSSFDFDSLTDVVGLNNDVQGRSYGNTERQPKTTREIAQSHIDNGNFEPDFFYDEDGEITSKDREFNFNDDVSDLTQQTEENHRTALQQFNSLNDDDYLDFEGYQATKGEVKEALRTKAEIEKQREAVETAYQSRRDGEEWIKREWMRRTTALERNAELIRSRMNAARNNTEYGELRRNLDHIEFEIRDVNETADRALRVQAEMQHNQKQAKILFEDQKLESVSPDWFDRKGEIIDYAFNTLKINPLILEEAYSQEVIQAIIESKKYREIVANSRSKAIAASKPKNATSTRSGASHQTTEHAHKAQKAIKNMGGSRQSNIDAFQFLKD
ncbi:hypothetical protein CB599_11675 [Salmonella enterica subsp. enterica serovar Adjame]|nr:hypothetical protein [Salmonella enterica subsp. enterica serovar Adjame]